MSGAHAHDPAVDHILAARGGAETGLTPLPPHLAPADEAAGYAIQRRIADRLGAVPPAGFKVGATGAAMRVYLGVHEPVGGFVPASGLRPEFRLSEFRVPGVECEIALRLAADLPPGEHDRDAVASAVGAAMAAIEVVDRRYDDFAAVGVPTLAADQMSHGGGALGPEVAEWRGLDLAALRGRLWVNGSLRGEGIGAELMGHPLEVLRWLAGSSLARAFGGLRAGQVVFLGSVCPPIWLEGGAPREVRVAFEGLGEATARFR